MTKDNFLIVREFDRGWHKRSDATRIPLGAAQVSKNITLTDRGGIAPRPGEVLIGTRNTGVNTGIRSMYSFKKTYGADILIKTFSDRIEYFNNVINDWCLLKKGYTPDKVFGFREHETDADALDWLYFCNSVDSYSRWCGYESKITEDLVGGESTIFVESTLLNDVFFTGSGVATDTTITVNPGTWATDIWNDFYVRITSGVYAGRISLISATTGNTITFASITGLAGAVDFEIRRLAVPASGVLIYGEDEVAYSAVPTDSSFTVSSAVAAPKDTGITVIPEEFPENPRGNIFETNIAQMYVAGVPKSKVTVYRSSLNDATDFTFSSPRSADQGDIIYFPYLGHRISDMARQEDKIYIFKRDSVEGLTYTQDAFDIARIEQIIQGVNVGTESRVWRMGNDIAYITPDKRITTIGRMIYRDARPQTNDIGSVIRRALEVYKVDEVYGEEFGDRVFIALKSSQDVEKNDIIIVYNKDNRSWEGYWQIAASTIVVHDGHLFYGSSYTPDVYKMLIGSDKVRGADVFPISAQWRSGFINLTGAGYYLNEVSMLAVEGYITSNSKININLYKDFSNTPFQELVIVGTEEQFIDGENVFSVLGGDPLGTEPLGAEGVFGDIEDGRRHFIIFLPFQTTQVEYLAVEFASNGLAQDWEILAFGINATTTKFEDQGRIKN